MCIRDSINGIGEADEKRRQDGRRELRQHHLEKRLPGIAAKVQRLSLIHISGRKRRVAVRKHGFLRQCAERGGGRAFFGVDGF